MTKPEVFAIGLGLGALITPAAIELTNRVLGRCSIDPAYRKENHG